MPSLQDMIIRHLETSHRSILVPNKALRRETVDIGFPNCCLFSFSFSLSSVFFRLFVFVSFFINKASLKFHTGITVSSLMLLP